MRILKKDNEDNAYLEFLFFMAGCEELGELLQVPRVIQLNLSTSLEHILQSDITIIAKVFQRNHMSPLYLNLHQLTLLTIQPGVETS